MNIVEVKNNLVKLFYEEDLTLSGLVKIKDGSRTYIAQIIHLEASRVGKFAICKIIFNYTDKVNAYDGTIPSLRAEVGLFDIKEFLEIMGHKDPVVLGKSISPDAKVCVDLNFLKDNPIILAEKFFSSRVLVNNFVLQLKARNKKVVVFDPIGIYKNNKLTLSKDFKLPLNSEGLDYIFEKEFEDATDESKVFVQPIFEELKAYSKTVEYIPFDTFKGVIDGEFQRTKLIQLIILKNKIKQIKDLNIYAEEQAEISALKEKLISNNPVVIDISTVKESVQKECIKYVYSILNELQTETYSFIPLNNNNSDKNLLNGILESENIHSSVICDYDYSLLPDLKKASKDMIMFTPIKQQKDFGGYNIFLQRLAEDEFIAYGKMSKFVPVIGKLYPVTAEDIKVVPQQEVKPDAEKSIPVENVEREVESVSEENNSVPEPVVVEAPVQEAVSESDAPVESEVENSVSESIEPTVSENVQEEVPTPSQEINISAVAGASAEEVIEAPEKPAEPIAEEMVTNSEIEDALKSVPEISDDDELSDDDLDMIEELSKPNEAIEVINEPVVESVGVVETEPVVESADVVETEAVQEEPEIETPAQDVQQDQVEVVEQQEAAENVDEKEETAESVEEVSENDIPPETDSEPLQTRANTTPVVPEYSAEIPEEDKVNSDPLKEGDRIMHQEFGEGVVEKIINYGDKLLCSVDFASVGRRLLNPEISEIHRL